MSSKKTVHEKNKEKFREIEHDLNLLYKINEFKDHYALIGELENKTGETREEILKVINKYDLFQHELPKEKKIVWKPKINQVIEELEKRQIELESYLDKKDVWRNQWNDIRSKWITFLFYGIIIILITTLIQVLVSYKLNERLAGPPCRIYVQKVFNQSENTEFDLPFLILNLKNERLIIDSVESLCYWTEKQISEKSDNTPTGLAMPNEPPSIANYEYYPWKSFCKSPNKQGTYPISRSVKTNRGTCEENILMVVE